MHFSPEFHTVVIVILCKAPLVSITNTVTAPSWLLLIPGTALSESANGYVEERVRKQIHRLEIEGVVFTKQKTD